MKNKVQNWFGKLRGNPFIMKMSQWMTRLWKVSTRHFGLKILSLLIAILLWNFVVSSNPNLTRTKTLTGLTGYLSGQSTLNTYNRLALLDDPSEELSSISVELEVPQAEYAYATADNVQVSLDLSSVRTAGMQQVPIKATTTYGRVVRTIPDSIPLMVETLDSRLIPVNTQVVGGDQEAYWYRVSRINPSSLTISGAASVVQSIAAAYVYVDVSGASQSFTSAERYVLLDSAGNEIPQSMLNWSSSSVTVSVEVYPTRDIPIASEIANVVTGQPADGYIVESVSIQPEMITVAAEDELLDSIEELHIEPVSVEGASQSFAVRATVSTLSSFKYVSADEVYVNVTIVEESEGVWVDNVKISYINKGENLDLETSAGEVRVYITGPHSAIEKLQENGFVATVDLEGIEAGTHKLPLTFPTETYPSVTFTPEVSEIEGILTDIAASQEQ